MAEEQPNEQKELTVKERRFVEEYCVKFNKTKAAIKAGYSKKTAKEIGYKLFTKVHIKAAVNARLQELSISAAETTKLISDIAKSDINEFYDVVEVEELSQIEKPLIEIIYELEQEVDFEEEFAKRAGLADEALKSHLSHQQSRKLKILRLQMELEREPLAKRKVAGPPVKRKIAELNMVKLVQAKEKGRIKSITPSQFGTKVELYPADAALRDMAKIHGLFIEKIDHTTGGKSFFDLLADSTDDGDTGEEG
jgi:phage terminase small subunit